MPPQPCRVPVKTDRWPRLAAAVRRIDLHEQPLGSFLPSAQAFLLRQSQSQSYEISHVTAVLHRRAGHAPRVTSIVRPIAALPRRPKHRPGSGSEYLMASGSAGIRPGSIRASRPSSCRAWCSAWRRLSLARRLSEGFRGNGAGDRARGWSGSPTLRSGGGRGLALNQRQLERRLHQPSINLDTSEVKRAFARLRLTGSVFAMALRGNFDQ